MSLQKTLDRIPAHLRQYVVTQDYDAYDEIDQSVWRFILLQTYNQLQKTAHDSYVDGLAKTGIFIDRIPRIEEMNECLGQFGWGAVCVDGFIPPRAFQEFQALGILTIAADMRTADHLAYTPAPDIVHESAGHAPIIPDRVYRTFLRRFGELSKRAFSCREDHAVYEAIRALSVVKEDFKSTPAMIKAAEEALLHAIDAITFTSEAALLSRLHWWTVEYGLVGVPENYKIYGAGILSSVAESLMLHLPAVKKRVLRTRCVETDYDITEQQPQLFVVPDFEALNEILDGVVMGFAFKVGGKLALQRALASGEVGTVVFNSGLQVTGILSEVVGEDPAYLQFSGPCALAVDDHHIPDHDRNRYPDGFGMPVGRLENGTTLSELTEWGLDRLDYKGPGSRLDLSFKSGVRVKGKLQRIGTNDAGYLNVLSFSDCTVSLGKRELHRSDRSLYHMGIGETVTAAFAGPADIAYWPETRFPEKRVPQKKVYSKSDRELLELFRDMVTARDSDDPGLVLPAFERISDTIIEKYPDHWLLPWNIMETLTKMDRGIRIASRLKHFMLEIESRRPRDIPVTMGLRYLGLA